MRIGEAAEHSGLSVDTIRFYEKSGLLPEIRRGGDGKRTFSLQDVDWLILLASLRDTGLSMQVMSRFAALYRQGDLTIAERRQILLQHSQTLEQKRRALDRCAVLLTHKLQLYDALEAQRNVKESP